MATAANGGSVSQPAFVSKRTIGMDDSQAYAPLKNPDGDAEDEPHKMPIYVPVFSADESRSLNDGDEKQYVSSVSQPISVS